MHLYEVGIYNKYVRKAVREDNNLPFGISSKWEDVLLFEYLAENESGAKKKAEFEFSPTLGYVVDGINKLGLG